MPDGGPPTCQNVRKKLDAARIDAVPDSKARQIGAVATRNNLGTGAGHPCTDACAAGNGAQARLDRRQEIAKRFLPLVCGIFCHSSKRAGREPVSQKQSE